MGISKKIRFEVFKRDSFTCQYCGQKAPDVILEADHIEPKSKGGPDDILNLITACRDCNRGKSNNRLSESDEIKKKRKQLEDLEGRRQQLEMLHSWQKELLNIDEEAVAQISEYWSYIAKGYHLNKNGIQDIRKLRKHFYDDEIMVAMKTAGDNYFQYAGDKITQESVDLAFNKVGGICHLSRKHKKDPGLKKVYYLRVVLRNRFDFFNEKYFWPLINEARQKGIDLDRCIETAKSARSWTAWRDFIRDYNEAR